MKRAAIGCSAGAAVVCLVIAGGSATSAPSGSARPSASAPASAKAPASASAKVDDRPQNPTLQAAALPATESPRPADADWKSAPEIDPTRGALPKECKAQLLREWVRITCRGSPGVGLVAGDPKYVKLGSSFTEAPLEMTSVADLAVRKGGSAIVTFVSSTAGLTALATAEGPTIQLGWRDAEPILLAYGP